MPDRRVRLGAAALAVAGAMFLLYPVVRPWHDETTQDGAVASMGSAAWVASHLFAMIGFVLVPFGLLALRSVVGRTTAEPRALTAVVVFWIGAGLTLPYYGAEDFALHAIAGRSADGHQLDVVDLAEQVRFGTVAVTTFGLGLLLLGAGGVLAALAVRRSGVLPRHAGVLLAVGFALFLPQFFTPGPVRIAHGVVLAAGCVRLARTLWRAAGDEVTQARSTVTLAGNSRSANRPIA